MKTWVQAWLTKHCNNSNIASDSNISKEIKLVKKAVTLEIDGKEKDMSKCRLKKKTYFKMID